MEPISDDELQDVRDAIADYDDYPNDLSHLHVNGRLTAGILARLDAAESRSAELQREVERLQESLRPVCSLPVDVAEEMEGDQC